MENLNHFFHPPKNSFVSQIVQTFTIKRSLSKQFLINFGILLIAVGLATSAINYYLVQTNLRYQVKEKVRSIIQGIEFATEGAIEAGYTDLLQRVVENYATLPTVADIIVVKPDGLILAHNMQSSRNRYYASECPELAEAIYRSIHDGVEDYFQTRVQNEEVLAGILPFSSASFSDTTRRGVIVTTINLKQVKQEAQRTFFASTIMVLFGNFIVLFLMGLLIQRSVLSPIYRLNTAIGSSKQTDHFVLPKELPDNEIKSLAVILDSTFKQIKKQDLLEQARRETEIANQALVRANRELIEMKEFAEQAQQKAETANRSKSTFLANMSHELRTPLNGILGYAQILSRDVTLTEKQRAGINVIQRSGDYLLTLINDVLDLSKIEAGRVEIYPTDFDFNEFLQGITELFQMRTQQKGIRFTYEPFSQLPSRVKGDEKRLRQILINLIGNAVKFTEQGEVILRVYTPQTNRMCFQVKDSGVGIAPEDIEKIFIPFQQVGDPKFRAEGTGLGLPITKKLVEMMGGTLQVDSIPGQGSAFSIEIDLPTVVDVTTPTQQEMPVIIGFEGESRTLLVIDDQAENRAVLRDLLVPLGFRVVEAENGIVGVTKARELIPDLILLDLIMPEMDGFDTARQLRTFPELRQTPIVAVSASVFEYYQQESLMVGCSAFIANPIRVPLLLELLGEYLKISWIYQDRQLLSMSKEREKDLAEIPLVGPTPQQAKILLDLALMGDIAGILEKLEVLEQEPKLARFVHETRQLAKNFQEEQICELIEKFITN